MKSNPCPFLKEKKNFTLKYFPRGDLSDHVLKFVPEFSLSALTNGPIIPARQRDRHRNEVVNYFAYNKLFS